MLKLDDQFGQDRDGYAQCEHIQKHSDEDERKSGSSLFHIYACAGRVTGGAARRANSASSKA